MTQVPVNVSYRRKVAELLSEAILSSVGLNPVRTSMIAEMDATDAAEQCLRHFNIAPDALEWERICADIQSANMAAEMFATADTEPQGEAR